MDHSQLEPMGTAAVLHHTGYAKHKQVMNHTARTRCSSSGVGNKCDCVSGFPVQRQGKSWAPHQPSEGHGALHLAGLYGGVIHKSISGAFLCQKLPEKTMGSSTCRQRRIRRQEYPPATLRGLQNAALHTGPRQAVWSPCEGCKTLNPQP